MSDDIIESGFDLELTVRNELIISGVPAVLPEINIKKTIETLVNDIKENTRNFKTDSKNHIAKLLAKVYSIDYGKKLEKEEISELLNSLFLCKMPNLSPDNKPIIKSFNFEEISGFFE